MTTQEIANRLVELCRKGDYSTCYEELYSPDVWSIEPKGAMNEKVQGMEGIQMKGKQWNENMLEFHGSSIGEPIIADNHFAVTMMYDATFKDRGRSKSEEICLYEVKEGKIVKEQFFYSMGAPSQEEE